MLIYVYKKMRKFRAIVQTPKEPMDHEVLWIWDGTLRFWNNDGWEPVVDVQAQVDLFNVNQPTPITIKTEVRKVYKDGKDKYKIHVTDDVFKVDDIVSYDIKDDLSSKDMYVDKVESGIIYVTSYSEPPKEGTDLYLTGDASAEEDRARFFMFHKVDGAVVLSQLYRTELSTNLKNCVVFRLGRNSNSNSDVWGADVDFTGVFKDREDGDIMKYTKKEIKLLRKDFNDTLLDNPYFSEDNKSWENATVGTGVDGTKFVAIVGNYIQQQQKNFNSLLIPTNEEMSYDVSIVYSAPTPNILSYCMRTSGNAEDVLFTQSKQITDQDINKKLIWNSTFQWNGQGYFQIQSMASVCIYSVIIRPSKANSIPLVTTSVDGLMSHQDKVKLNSINSGAESNQNAFSSVITPNRTINAALEQDEISFVPGNNVTIQAFPHNNAIQISATDTTYQVASTDNDGLMSSQDKTRLDTLVSTNQIIELDTDTATSERYAEVVNILKTPGNHIVHIVGSDFEESGLSEWKHGPWETNEYDGTVESVSYDVTETFISKDTIKIHPQSGVTIDSKTYFYVPEPNIALDNGKVLKFTTDEGIHWELP